LPRRLRVRLPAPLLPGIPPHRLGLHALSSGRGGPGGGTPPAGNTGRGDPPRGPPKILGLTSNLGEARAAAGTNRVTCPCRGSVGSISVLSISSAPQAAPGGNAGPDQCHQSGAAGDTGGFPAERRPTSPAAPRRWANSPQAHQRSGVE